MLTVLQSFVVIAFAVTMVNDQSLVVILSAGLV